jgi:hypothetical protein
MRRRRAVDERIRILTEAHRAALYVGVAVP